MIHDYILYGGNIMKAAIVTGVSSGIGQAIAKRLLILQYKVYGLSRTASTDKVLCESSNFQPILCDLTNTGTLVQIITEIKQQGEVNLLVNNAGVGYYGPHEELNPKKIHEMTTVNIEVPLLLTNLLLRDLKKTQGTVLNISSVTAEKANPHGCAYGATKAALSSFSSSLFEETRKYGVKVITIQPDMTQTNLYRNANFREGTTPDTYLTPEEIADTVEYALSLREGVVLREITLTPQRHQITKK